MSQLQTVPTLKQRLADPSTTLEAIQGHLDSLAFEQQLKECMALGKKEQSRLFELAENNPCTLDDLVPAGTSPDQQVVFEGKNTLPVFTRFQKIFCRAKDDPNLLYGFNEGFTRKFIGPGYFVAHMCDVPPSKPHWPAHGASVVNYSMVPPSNDVVVPGWPKVKPNSSGLQMFVYKGTRDFMRKITDDVSIGEAFKGAKPLNNFFTLVRRPNN